MCSRTLSGRGPVVSHAGFGPVCTQARREALVRDLYACFYGLDYLQFAFLEYFLEFACPFEFHFWTEEWPKRVKGFAQLTVTRDLVDQAEPRPDVGQVLGQAWERV